MASSELSWQTAFWCVAAVALTTMSQASVWTLGFSSRYTFYIRTSPMVCLSHIITTIFQLLWFAISKGSISNGLEAWKNLHFEDVPKENENTFAGLRDYSIIKLALFILGALLPALKLYVCTGIPWTQTICSIYLICFLLDEALYQFCAHNEPRGRWLRPVQAPKPDFMDIEVASWTTMAFDGSVSTIALLQGFWGSRIPGPIAIFAIGCFSSLLFSSFIMASADLKSGSFLMSPICMWLGLGFWMYGEFVAPALWDVLQRMQPLTVAGWIVGSIIIGLHVVVWLIIIGIGAAIAYFMHESSFVQRQKESVNIWLERSKLLCARLHGLCWLIIGILMFARVYTSEDTHDPHWLHVLG